MGFVPEDHWLNDLQKLAPIAAGLATIGSDPEAWVRMLIAEWIVGGIIDAAQYVLGWIFFAIERTTSIIVDGLGPLTTPFEVIGDAIVGAFGLIYEAAEGVANTAGLAGPPAAAFAFALVMTLLAAVVYAVIKAFPVTNGIESGLEVLR
ncbi:hypothetical protein [Halorussus amylolyticus]|uniref:hypothetical protein n=1 Tax=Halorussus amylolyticus TaxID=1126242 RepID=UPI0010481F46|nr:hypothetical protein [Halorussus amylolyticus]